MTQNKIADNSLFDIRQLPGHDPVRNTFLGLFTGILLFLIGYFEIPPVIPLLIRKISFILLICEILFALISMFFTIMTRSVNVSEVASISKRDMFLPSILTEIAIILFFFIICLWVFALGGVTVSPFASIITISPVFFLLRYLTRNEAVLFNQIFEQVSSQEKARAKKYIDLIRWLRLLPMIVVILTITLGEFIQYKADILVMISLKKDIIIQAVQNSDWGLRTTYFVFFLSFLAAALSIIRWERFFLQEPT